MARAPTEPPAASLPAFGATGLHSLVGHRLGDKYRVLDELSRGGMGAVYRAEQVSLRRQVAIKVILAGDDPTANQRFLLEASLTA